jgi:hypothetical protein
MLHPREPQTGGQWKVVRPNAMRLRRNPLGEHFSVQNRELAMRPLPNNEDKMQPGIR